MRVIKVSIRNLYKESIIGTATGRTGSKELHVYDFDDTLVDTRTSDLRVRVYKVLPGGEEELMDTLSSEQFATYSMPTSGQIKMDFSDFDRAPSTLGLKEKWVDFVESLRNKDIEVIILTARSADKPVQEFIRQKLDDPDIDGAGLEVPHIKALGNSDPLKKSAYIKDMVVEQGFTVVRFWDDSEKNVVAVRALAAEFESEGMHVDIEAEEVAESYQRASSFRDMTRDFLYKLSGF
tara:strand:- start:3621 stop:4328 length:708 start_codon:yes stop_codon:yes gene_type:complete